MLSINFASPDYSTKGKTAELNSAHSRRNHPLLFDERLKTAPSCAQFSASAHAYTRAVGWPRPPAGEAMDYRCGEGIIGMEPSDNGDVRVASDLGICFHFNRTRRFRQSSSACMRNRNSRTQRWRKMKAPLPRRRNPDAEPSAWPFCCFINLHSTAFLTAVHFSASGGRSPTRTDAEAMRKALLFLCQFHAKIVGDLLTTLAQFFASGSGIVFDDRSVT